MGGVLAGARRALSLPRILVQPAEDALLLSHERQVTRRIADHRDRRTTHGEFYYLVLGPVSACPLAFHRAFRKAEKPFVTNDWDEWIVSYIILYGLPPSISAFLNNED